METPKQPKIEYSAAIENMKYYQEKLDHTNRHIKKAKNRISQLEKNINNLINQEDPRIELGVLQFIATMREEIKEWHELLKDLRKDRNEYILLIGHSNLDEQRLQRKMEDDDQIGHA